METRIDPTEIASASPRFDAIRVGQTASMEVLVSERAVLAFAELSGDVNPLHLDADEARAAGYPRRVAHGMIAASAISALIGTKIPGAGALWLAHDVQFTAPVFVGDTIRASVTVEQVSRATRLVILRTDAINLATGASVLTGRAKVKVMEKERPEPSTTGERVALVTGSSRGLGRAIAVALAQSGHHVVVHYHSRGDAAGEVVREIDEAGTGRRAVACQADLRDPAGAEQLFDAACRAFGNVDVLVNNATPQIVRRPFLECAWSEFAEFLNVYVQSTVRLMQLAAPAMQERRFGRVINVLSSYAFGVPPARLSPYVTAKAALAGLSRSLAVEFGAFGVTVNMVAPSVLVTEQTAAIGNRARQLAAAQAPLRRLPELDEVAATVAFLASPQAGAITGAVLPVAAGEVMPT